MKILDTAGTLELSDTGRRCSNLPDGGEIVRVRCTACEESQVMDVNLAAFYWATKKADGGWHLGCLDPEERDRRRAELATYGAPIPNDACPACHRSDCGGAVA